MSDTQPKHAETRAPMIEKSERRIKVWCFTPEAHLWIRLNGPKYGRLYPPSPMEWYDLFLYQTQDIDRAFDEITSGLGVDPICMALDAEEDDDTE